MSSAEYSRFGWCPDCDNVVLYGPSDMGPFDLQNVIPKLCPKCDTPLIKASIGTPIEDLAKQALASTRTIVRSLQAKVADLERQLAERDTRRCATCQHWIGYCVDDDDHLVQCENWQPRPEPAP